MSLENVMNLAKSLGIQRTGTQHNRVYPNAETVVCTKCLQSWSMGGAEPTCAGFAGNVDQPGE